MNPTTLINLLGLQGDHSGQYFSVSSKSINGKWRDEILPTRHLESSLASWLKAHPEDKFDLYFCPLPLKKPRRIKENVVGSRLLWADLDKINLDKLPFKPTVLWESSPGRYQGLWKLDKFLSPKRAEKLCQWMTKVSGADPGGWDLTQVLRIPGTINHKYSTKPRVHLLFRSGPVYLSHELLKKIPPPDPQPQIKSLNSNEVMQKYRTRIPKSILNLIGQEPEIGKRSDTIWFLEHKLHELGLSPDEIISIIRSSPWNKYRGRRDELVRLKTELEKIISSDLPTNTTSSTQKIVFEPYSKVMGSIVSEPGWLVKHFWTRQSHGIVAGEPKSFKSLLVTDLAVSIASGKPFLDQFEVVEPGPVIMIQNENSSWIMKDRLQKISYHYGLHGKVFVSNNQLTLTPPRDLPIHFVNQQNFLLDFIPHCKIIEEVVEDIKPALVIFDPLYLMFGGDVNSAQELNPILSWLLSIKSRFNTGVLVVHHWNKGGVNPRGGQRMLGSTTLHGWVESAWYVGVNNRKPTDVSGSEANSQQISASIILEREFRAAPIYPKLEIVVGMGGFGSGDYQIDVEEYHSNTSDHGMVDAELQIRNLLSLSSESLSQRVLSQRLGISRRLVIKALKDLETQGIVETTDTGTKLVEA